MADEAVCIGEAPSSESYLNVPNLLAAAVSRGAQAVHPVSKPTQLVKCQSELQAARNLEGHSTSKHG
jgi:biotin carboxylase